ncbi:phage tail assembly protein [Methylobacterium sp. DB1607]|nr:phage tail assembly protein [Methylobacterium sp. DB1607]
MSDETNATATGPAPIKWPLEFPLSAVVEAHGEDTKVLILRAPTGDDVFKFGLLDGLQNEQFLPLVARLAGVPEGTIRKLPAEDVLALATKLARFFIQAAMRG